MDLEFREIRHREAWNAAHIRLREANAKRVRHTKLSEKQHKHI